MKREPHLYLPLRAVINLHNSRHRRSPGTGLPISPSGTRKRNRVRAGEENRLHSLLHDDRCKKTHVTVSPRYSHIPTESCKEKQSYRYGPR